MASTLSAGDDQELVGTQQGDDDERMFSGTHRTRLSSASAVSSAQIKSLPIKSYTPGRELDYMCAGRWIPFILIGLGLCVCVCALAVGVVSAGRDGRIAGLVVSCVQRLPAMAPCLWQEECTEGLQWYAGVGSGGAEEGPTPAISRFSDGWATG